MELIVTDETKNAPPRKRVRQKEGDINYVNNKEFHAAMLAWGYDRMAAAFDCKPEPRLPNKIALMITKIVRRYASCHNFYRYTWKDEMIGDAIYTCMMYANRYDGFTYDNPFAYFTTVAKRAFIKRIKIEQNEIHIKAKFLQTSGLCDLASISKQTHDMDSSFSNTYADFLRGLDDTILPEKKAKIPKVIENVCEESNLFK